MTVYRLCSRRYPANSGDGAAHYGGRWNRVGTKAIYAASSPSLAALEIVVNYEDLPADFVLTEIEIPSHFGILRLERGDLPPGWDRESISPATQEIGETWIREAVYPVLSVPSSIVQVDRNYVLNPLHADFASVRFLPPLPFGFDTRLKRPKR